ncbi:MAG: hypothetical protein EXS05_08455 [Planctomycetaceae bacterium]|nr:hypothetical protein [Planctomycetaceae bacterium]
MAKAPIQFRGFDESGQVRIYSHGILPHWRQTGCMYFVTFRLDDSIPAPVLQEIEYERKLWLKARGIDSDERNWKRCFAKLTRNDRRVYEQLVGRLINKSLDECHGACVLRNSAFGNPIAVALGHFHESRVLTGDFVVMPNHVHALLTPINGYELEHILHSIKSYTANIINQMRKSDGTFWQRESYDHIVRDAEQLVAFQQYIAANPAKANLNDGEYIVSSAEYKMDP